MQACLSIPTHGGSLRCQQPILSVPGATTNTLVSPLGSSHSPFGLLPQEGTMDKHTQLWHSATVCAGLWPLPARCLLRLLSLGPAGHSERPGSSPSPPPHWRALAPRRVLCAGLRPSSSPDPRPGGPARLCVAGRTPQLRSWGCGKQKELQLSPACPSNSSRIAHYNRSSQPVLYEERDLQGPLERGSYPSTQGP